MKCITKHTFETARTVHHRFDVTESETRHSLENCVFYYWRWPHTNPECTLP